MSFSVIVPSKSATNVKACIEAIRKHEPDLPGEKIIVVDDGIDWYDVGPQSCDYRILQGVKPFVFSRACNMGIKAAGEDDVILMNDDALLTTTFGFTLMAKSAAAHPEVGLIGAACNNVGNPNQFQRNFEGMRHEPRMVCFVCVYIPRSTIETVGLLDERYVDYGMDDDDYCFEVRKAGLKIGIHGGCYVSHDKLESSFRGAPNTASDFRPNMALFIDKWGHDNWGVPAEQARRKWGVK